MSFKDVGLRLEPQTLLAAHDLRHVQTTGRIPSSRCQTTRRHLNARRGEFEFGISWTAFFGLQIEIAKHFPQ
jgi:hypothetical protein